MLEKTQDVNVEAVMADIGLKAKEAAAKLAFAPTKAKNDALLAMADEIERNAADILTANAEDLGCSQGKRYGGCIC